MEAQELRDLYPEAINQIEKEAIKAYLDSQRQSVDRFTFYRTYWEAARCMTAKNRAKFIEGILDYAFLGVVPEFDNATQSAFVGIRPNIDNSIDSVIYGKSGGRPRKQQTQSTGRTASSEQVKAIIDYLNEKTGKNYRATSDRAIKPINARINEGYALDDFYKVIDVKTAEWLGSDAEQWLRPETLFGPKFDGYLNQAKRKKPGDGYEQYD